MLISKFELLAKPLQPKEFSSLPFIEFNQLSLPVTHRYSLAITNATSSQVIVTLVFTAITQSVNVDQIFAFTKATGVNIPSNLAGVTVPSKIKFSIPISASDICLFILQPDILISSWDLNEEKFEVHGNVEIFVSSFSLLRFNKLILTPEYREASLGNSITSKPQYAQSEHSFSIANGDFFLNHPDFTPSEIGEKLVPQTLDVLHISQLGS